MEGADDILMACTVGDLPWLKRGLKRGIDPGRRNREGMTGLHLAALSANLDCMRHLLDNCDIAVDDQAPPTGNTPLHCSTSRKGRGKSVQCMKLLVDRGANIIQRNEVGHTPLHIAAKVGHTGCLKVLLERGADIHLVDNNDKTAYDLACLHGRHECARLLRALHWASNKDASMTRKLHTERTRQNREKEMKAVHTRIKQELADNAYQNWKQKKDRSGGALSARPETPVECEHRHHVRSQPNRASTCGTCSQVASERQSAMSSHVKVTIPTPIRVSLAQAQRNTHGIGEPDKLYPYTNYPPEELRGQRSSSSKKARPTRSPYSRSSSRMSRSTRSTPTPKDTRSARKPSKGTEVQSMVSPLLVEVAKTSNSHNRPQKNTNTPALQEPHLSPDIPVHETHEESSEDENYTPTQLPLPSETLERQTLEVAEDQMWLQPPNGTLTAEVTGGLEEGWEEEGEEEEGWDDDELFHDVGHTNSLNALSLPGVLTKSGKSAAEVVQLLRFSSSFGQRSKNVRRINSYTLGSSSRGAFGRGRFQRRFSLGAIPEGEMVTSYSDEDRSTVQLLDDQFFNYSYTATTGKVDTVTGKLDEHDDADERLGSLDLSGSSDEDVFEEEVEAHEHIRNTSQFEDSSERLSKSDTTLFTRRRSAMLTESKPNRAVSLTIINLGLDPMTNAKDSKSTAQAVRSRKSEERRQCWTAASDSTTHSEHVNSLNPPRSLSLGSNRPVKTTRVPSPFPSGQHYYQHTTLGQAVHSSQARPNSSFVGGESTLTPPEKPISSPSTHKPVRAVSPSSSGRTSPQTLKLPVTTTSSKQSPRSRSIPQSPVEQKNQHSSRSLSATLNEPTSSQTLTEHRSPSPGGWTPHGSSNGRNSPQLSDSFHLPLSNGQNSSQLCDSFQRPLSSGRVSPRSSSRMELHSPSSTNLSQSADLSLELPPPCPSASLFAQSPNALKSTSSFKSIPSSTDQHDSEGMSSHRPHSAPVVIGRQRPVRVLKSAVFQFGGTLKYT